MKIKIHGLPQWLQTEAVAEEIASSVALVLKQCFRKNFGIETTFLAGANVPSIEDGETERGIRIFVAGSEMVGREDIILAFVLAALMRIYDRVRLPMPPCAPVVRLHATA